jgi:hypothetical protein
MKFVALGSVSDLSENIWTTCPATNYPVPLPTLTSAPVVIGTEETEEIQEEANGTLAEEDQVPIREAKSDS